MDIRLATNTDNPCLELKGCRTIDESDFESTLVVRSGPFQAEISFWFDGASVKEALSCLKQMQLFLTGGFKLGYRYEETFISFKGDGLGHIDVSGVLTQYSRLGQRLEFGFQTDQTCIAPLIADLESLIHSRAS